MSGSNSRTYKTIRSFEVDKILDRKIVCGKVRYLVKWRRTFSELNTWEIKESFYEPSIIDKFELEWQKKQQKARNSVLSRQSLGNTSKTYLFKKSGVKSKDDQNVASISSVEKHPVVVSEASHYSKKVESLKTLIETELQCSICFDIFKNPCVTDCEHIFCDKCIDQWKKQNRSCPICRSVLSRSEKKLMRLDNFIVKAGELLKNND